MRSSGVLGVWLLGSFALVWARPQSLSYMAFYDDPHPVRTYGAHPFHIQQHSTEDHEEAGEHSHPHQGEHYSEEDHVPYTQLSSRRGSPYRGGPSLKRRFRSRGSHETGKRKYPPHPQRTHNSQSHEEHEEVEVEEAPMAVLPLQGQGQGFTSLLSSRLSSYLPISSAQEVYSSSKGYIPQGWFNTVGGGYDDYGYNYDRSSPNNPIYKGPPTTNNLYSAYSSPSSSEHEAPGIFYYAYGTGAVAQPLKGSASYGDDHKQEGKTRLPSTPGSRRPSNGYGQDPYFTFGPKKVTKPSGYSTTTYNEEYNEEPHPLTHKLKPKKKPVVRDSYFPQNKPGRGGSKGKKRPFPPSYYNDDTKETNTKEDAFSYDGVDQQQHQGWDEEKNGSSVIHQHDPQSSDNHVHKRPPPHNKHHAQHKKQRHNTNAPKHPRAQRKSPSALDLLRRFKKRPRTHKPQHHTPNPTHNKY